MDEDDSEDEIVVQHRSKSVAMRRKVLVLDDSEDDVTDSDIEFTTEDVKEEDDDDAFEDALDASFSESSNKNKFVVPFSSMTPTLRSSSSSDDEDSEFDTNNRDGGEATDDNAAKEKTTERGELRCEDIALPSVSESGGEESVCDDDAIANSDVGGGSGETDDGRSKTLRPGRVPTRA